MDVERDAELCLRLAALKRELSGIGVKMGSMFAELKYSVEPIAVGHRDEPVFLRSVIRMRRLRDRYFPSSQIFADPAWDILLDLRMAALEGRRVPVSSLCVAAAVPATTALRWIGLLVEKGLLMRFPDLEDGRRSYVGLTPRADKMMVAFSHAAILQATLLTRELMA